MILPRDEAGAGPAVVLLLHAGVADRTMWSEQLEALAGAGLRAVAVGLPGFGEVPFGPGEHAPWADVLETMDALSIERAAVVGNSFGGAVALRVAVTAPERVTALVLVSAPAPGVEPSPALEAAWAAEESALARGDADGAVTAVVEAWTLPDAPRSLRERVAAMQRCTYALQGDTDEPPPAPDPVDQDPEALARLTVPTLVAVGARDMEDFRAGADVLAHAIPGARHIVIDGAGHLAPLETPESFAKLVLGFVG